MTQEYRYIVTLNNGKSDVYAIFKDVTDRLKEVPDITILELLNYLLQEPLYDESEINTARKIKKLVQKIKTHKNLFLLIRSLSEDNSYRKFPNSNKYTEVVNPKGLASNYFELRFLDPIEYKALDLKLGIARWKGDQNYA